MTTTIYDTNTVTLIDNTQIEIMPLKIKYLKELMVLFETKTKMVTNDDEMLDLIIECVLIAMKQYYPQIKNKEQLEDVLDIKTMYEILEVSSGIKMSNPENPEPNKKQQNSKGWDDLDLAKLESEVFLLGIWKDYEELELSLSMPELTATLEAKREDDYNHKKFLAAIQGVDLDKESGKQNAWEEMKARVFSGGKATGANDVVALQGANAQKAGFGIGMGLSYERID
jgi:hypothetical protein